MIAGNIPRRTQTMAVAIYDAMQSGNTLPANLMVLIISLTAIAILYATNRIQGKRLL